ncbi:MAG: response regulator [Saprospiraceae bacterium]|jgi:DNA-binding NtrC family response regulator|nr:response regulator [Saprospiraceae bacterium]MBK7372965.1 response regulator [Saprospiraceae bacterium]MBK7439691.1 response regulator [Saprospiraceae bacterium]MBK7606092.1 response regulator [Saprospiraceae bacterium]MBK9681485.1 response regulator [Saprospiraceae bacterium]
MSKILVVDDEEDQEDLIIQRFVNKDLFQDYEFIFARNGLEALQKIKKYPEIEILMIDINMPKMDGFTLMKKSKAINPILCFILISAYDDEANIKSGYEHGAFEFVNKPIDFLLLEDALRRIMLHVEDLRQSIKAKKGIE